MKVAVLSANLGGFDTPVEHAKQNMDATFHTFTYDDFPPIADLPPRFQYRIPKLFGWQMFPGYDMYVWLDGSIRLTSKDSLKWLTGKVAGKDIAFFKHPHRKTVKEEVDHLEDYLTRKKGTKRGQDYLIARYKNGLHKEQYEALMTGGYRDDVLYASPIFVYKSSIEAQNCLIRWWLHQSRYYTCDQVALPYALLGAKVGVIPGNPFKNDYIEVGSKHD